MVLMKRHTGLILKSQTIIKFSLLGVLSLISACVLQTDRHDPFASKEPIQEYKAEQLLARGHYQDAAELYQQFAQNPSPRQNILRLKAAQAFLKISEDDKTRINLNLIVPEKLNTEQLNHLYLMYVQIDLNAGNIEQALNYSMHISVPVLSQIQTAKYYIATASLYASTGQTVKSIQQRIALDLYLNTQQQKEHNNKAILALLKRLSQQTLLEQQQQQQSIVYSGWLALEQTLRNFLDTIQQQALNKWMLQYPQHPAQALISSGYFLVAKFKLENLRVIAVFLPESGPFSAAVAALKAGFSVAYNQQDENKPDVRFYDTQQADISTIYRQAVADGAQLIIGPLNKKYIKELAQHNDLNVPVMALNHVDGLVKANLYQFALSPIDEVKQIVRQASFRGHKNAVILAPRIVDGERISQYFQHEWIALNGNILAVQDFDPKTKDFSFPVRQVLGINESRHRFQQLKQVMGAVKYQPRRRQDVDVIFLVASDKNAPLINPHFYHNRAGSVSVYGLSRVYQDYLDRPIDRQKNIDLENVSFCTIPWLFDAVYPDELNLLSLQEITRRHSQHLNLIAFGIDAYAIVNHLNNIDTMPYHGATGDLLLNECNRIERHLVCAKFKHGKASLVEMAEEDEISVAKITPTNTSLRCKLKP